MFWSGLDTAPPERLPQDESKAPEEQVQVTSNDENPSGDDEEPGEVYEDSKRVSLSLDPLKLFGNDNDFQKNLNAFGDVLGAGAQGGLDNTAVLLEEGLELAIEREEYYRRYITTILLNSLNPSMWVNVSTIPDIWVRIMSILAMVIYATILVYYGYSAFDQGMTDTFLSLNPSQGVCHQVVKTADSNLKLSLSGDFESSTDFYAHSTAYRIQLAGFSGGEGGFSYLLSETGESVKAISEKGSSRSKPWNLVAWASYTQQVG